MKRIMLLILVMVLGLNFCIGQSKKTDKSVTPGLSKTNNGVNKPQTNIKVNREYDKNGNLISYDSTYSWSYSGGGENTMLNDSILNEFKNFFSQDLPSSMNVFFDKVIPRDSASENNTDINDFFTSRRRQYMENINKFFSGMDSVGYNLKPEKVQPESNMVAPKSNNEVIPEIKRK